MLWEKLVEFWPTIKDGLNSNFTTSLLGALAGAWGGAQAVRKISDRSKTREQMLQEIKSVNSALHLLFGMANPCLNLKEQQVIGLFHTYQQQREKVHDAFRRRQAGEQVAPPEIGVVDLSNMDVLRFNLDALEKVFLEKISITGRILPMFGIFVQAVEALNQLILQRNNFVAQVPGLPNDVRLALIFGVRLPDGSVDDKYGGYIEGIYQTTDDCIYFAVRLMKNLEIYGERVRDRYVRRFGEDAPKIDRIVFDRAVAKGLLPDVKNYASWEGAFINLVPSTDPHRRWERRWHVIRLWARRPKTLWRRRKSSRRVGASSSNSPL